MRIKRFSPTMRLFHLGLMVLFMFQAATGLARTYHGTVLGRVLTDLFGGTEMCLKSHKQAGLFLIGLFLLHLVYLAIKIRRLGPRAALFGPDSLLPRPSDAAMFIKHLGWMLGMARHPPFDRWGYWEKFDYWAVFWGMAVIGGTGLVLAFPLAASTLMPGWTINVAFWIHRIEAGLAMAHIFLIHFFIAHLRRSAFPMDHAMFDGSVPLEQARHERASWTARLEFGPGVAETAAPSRFFKIAAFAFGTVMVACGLTLLVLGIANAPYLGW